jgi:hypothetical protein
MLRKSFEMIKYQMVKCLQTFIMLYASEVHLFRVIFSMMQVLVKSKIFWARHKKKVNGF